MKKNKVLVMVCTMTMLFGMFSARAHAYAAGNNVKNSESLSSSDYLIGKPSSDDFDAIGADIVYPRKESYYLNEYKYATVTANGVFAFKNPNADDVMATGNTFRLNRGEEVVVIAESPGYACVIFPNLGRAGWINRDYLKYETQLPSFSEQKYGSPSAADLDAIHADITYPRQDSFYL